MSRALPLWVGLGSAAQLWAEPVLLSHLSDLPFPGTLPGLCAPAGSCVLAQDPRSRGASKAQLPSPFGGASWALGLPPGPLRVVPGSPPAPSLVSCLPQLRPLGWADPGPAGAQLCLLPLDHPLAFSRTSLLRPPLGAMFALLSEHTFVLSTVTGDWRALGYNCLPRARAMLRVSLGDSHC